MLYIVTGGLSVCFVFFGLSAILDTNNNSAPQDCSERISGHAGIEIAKESADYLFVLTSKVSTLYLPTINFYTYPKFSETIHQVFR